jgi:hypothetical protein
LVDWAVGGRRAQCHILFSHIFSAENKNNNRKNQFAVSPLEILGSIIETFVQREKSWRFLNRQLYSGI